MTEAPANNRPTQSERRILMAIIEELRRQHDNEQDGPFVYGHLIDSGIDLEEEYDWSLGIDGQTDLLALLRAIRRSEARLMSDPPSHGRHVLVQYHLARGTTRLTCQDSAWYNHAQGRWELDVAEGTYTILCWWEHPELLSEQDLRDLEPKPAPPPEQVPTETALQVLQRDLGGQCSKCGRYSGDDWSQCRGSCPIPGSPYHNDAETMRQFLRSLRRG